MVAELAATIPKVAMTENHGHRKSKKEYLVCERPNFGFHQGIKGAFAYIYLEDPSRETGEPPGLFQLCE